MTQYKQLFINGIIITIELTLISVAFGAILGLLVALLKMSNIKIVSFLGTTST